MEEISNALEKSYLWGYEINGFCFVWTTLYAYLELGSLQ